MAAIVNCTPREQAQKDADLKKVWYKQAYLMAYMESVTSALRPSGGKLNGWNPSKYIKLISTPRQNDAIVNRLTVSQDVMMFLDGTPFDYSQLVPHIEIHKVYIKNKEDQEEVLFPFTAFTDFDREWSRKNLHTPFRGQDAGIQSVALQMDGLGKNPAQSNIMHATVKFVFNDVKTLFKVWKTREEGPGGTGVQYADLIRYPHKLQDPKTKNQSKPAAFRIRIQVGWNMYKKDTTIGGINLGASIGDTLGISPTKFVDAVQRTKISFLGDMHTHDMDFKEDGSVVLTVKYRGALDMAFISPQADLMNNFTLDGSKSMRDLKADLTAAENTIYLESLGTGNSDRQMRMKFIMSLQKKLAETAKDAGDIKKALASTTFFANAISQFSKNGDEVQKLKTLLATASGAPLRTSWQAIVQVSQATAVGIAGVDAAIPGEMLDDALAFEKSAAADKGELGKNFKKKLREATNEISKRIQSLEDQTKAKYIFTFVQELMQKNRVAWINTKGNDAFTKYTAYQDALEGKKPDMDKAAGAYGDIKMQPDTAATIADQAKDHIRTVVYDEKEKKLVYTPGDKVMFFLLGDLISTILDHGTFGTGIEQLSPGFRIILGNIDYYPPGREHYGNPINFSLYDLPISLEHFINFISEKIIGDQRSSYYFGPFLKDLIKWLIDRVVGTMGPAAEGTRMVRKRPARQFKIELTSAVVPKEIVKSGWEKGIHTNPYIVLSSVNKSLESIAKKTTVNELANTWILQAHRNAPFRERIKKHQKADPEEDRKDGIFHFMVGGPNRGLLKSIKFAEHKNSDFSTAMWRNATGGGTASARGIIRPAKFTCELTLIGNPFFYVGQYFYVNTALFSNDHFSRELIMNGGYYFVISVQNNFAAGKWETTIKGTMEIADFVVKRGGIANTVNTKGAPSLAELTGIKPKLYPGNKTEPPKTEKPVSFGKTASNVPPADR